MSSIDKRIVQMQFDNQNFESGVKTTMSTLQKLNEKLKMKGSTDGLDSVNKGINKLSSSSGLSGLSSGVETVTSKFSALGVIGMTALANITNSAVNAGKNLVKSLTIDPITTGFSEYETKMGSIQTILTNTAHAGTTLEDVTKVLNDLNTYSDQTIYNFAEMTKNIGTFTAAGIDLDTSAAAIKGIANLAAASGSTSQQASTAMYQLSQALAAGKVSLADWNSVVNAGMGGKLFQDSLIRTSEMLGTGAEAMIEKYGSFRESLTNGEWLTSEVLTETLKQLSGAYTEADLIAQGFTKSQAQEIVKLAENATAAATEVKTVTQLMDTMKETVQSGWATSWEHILGDKNEATELLTSISNAFNNLIGPSTEARNNMLAFWNEAGGRNAAIRGFTNIFESLGKGMRAIGDAWKEVFPSMTGEKLTELSTKFRDFTYKIKMSDETAQKIKDTFKGMFNVFKTVGTAIGGVVKAFAPLLGIVKPIGAGLLNMSSSIGKFVTKISDVVSKSNVFTKIGEGVGKAFISIGEHIEGAYDKITGFFNKLDFSNVTSAFSKVASTIGQFMSTIAQGIGKALGSINFDTLINMGKGLAGLGIFKVVKKIFDEFKGVGDGLTGVFDSFKGIGDNVKGVLDGVKDSLTSWQNSLNSGTIMKLAGAIAILAGSLLILASIEPGRLASALAGMAGLFTELSVAMIVMNKKLSDIKGLTKISLGMILLSTAILILSSAMKKLSGLNIGEVLTGLVSIAGLLATLVVAAKQFDKSYKDLMKTSTSLIVFGAAMHVMAGALRKLGELDPAVIGTGLIALAGMLTELVVFLRVLKDGSLTISTATGVLILAGALLVLQQAIKKLGELDPGTIITGLAAIMGMLAIIALFDDFVESGMGMVATGLGLASMSAGILVMSAALKSLVAIPFNELGNGLVALTGGLLVLGLASELLSPGNMILVGVGIAAMSASLLVLSAALKSLAEMSMDEIGRSLVALSGSLLILGLAAAAMTECIVGALALIVLAGALALMVPPLVALGNMSMAEIGKSLLMLASSLIVLGLAGAAIGVVSPLIALAGAAIALLGVGCIAAGTGVTMIATGMATLAATFTSSGTTIINFIDQLITKLPEMGIKAAEGFANFMGALATAVPQITTGFTAIIGAILTAIGTLIPQLVQTGLDIAVAFAQGLATAVPQLVTAGMELVLGVLQGIAANIGGIIQAGADIIVNFLNGIASNLGRIIEAGINLAISFIEGVANGLNSNQGRLEAAIRSVIQAILTTGLAVIRGGISGFTSGGKQLLQGLVNGIKSMMSSAGSAVKSCIDAAKRAASNLGSALVSAGKSLIQGLVTGIKNMASSVASAAKDVVQGAITAAKNALKINSPSKVFIEIGKYTSEGFAVGLDKYSKYASDSATDLANTVIDTVKNPLSNLAKMVDGEIDATPVIAPVMDLSNVRAGSNAINSMLATNDMSINANATGVIARSIGRIQNGNTNNDVVNAVKDLQKSIAGNSGNTYQINGITYDDGSNVQSAVETLIRAAMIERRM